METTLAPVPFRFVREVVNGINYYYEGYRKILSGEQTLEAIMGSSDLQSTLVTIIFAYLLPQIDRKEYQMVISEPGLHLSTGNNFSNGIAIYRKTDLPLNRDRTKYFPVAPHVAIEVDIRIEAEEGASDDFSYMFQKSQQMLEAGTTQVVWVLSKIHSLVVFTLQPDNNSIQPKVIPWAQVHEILPGVSIKLAQWLESEGEYSLL